MFSPLVACHERSKVFEFITVLRSLVGTVTPLGTTNEVRSYLKLVKSKILIL